MTHQSQSSDAIARRRVIRWLALQSAGLIAVGAACSAPTPTAAPSPAAAKPAPAAPTAPPSAAPPSAAPTKAAEPKAAPTPAPPLAKSLRVGLPPAGIDHVPLLLGFDAIRAKGVDLKLTNFSSTAQPLQALIAGELDVASGEIDNLLKVNQQGENILGFVQRRSVPWMLLVKTSITDPKQLDGKKIGFGGYNGPTDAYLTWTEKKFGVKPDRLLIAGSSARAEALQSGVLDGTVAEFDDVFRITRGKPGQFHAILSYAKELPGVMGSMLVARKDFMEKNAPTFEALCEATLVAFRQANDQPKIVVDAAPKFLPGTNASDLNDLVPALKQIGTWDPNGGFDNPQVTITFYKETGMVGADVDASLERWATTKYVTAALGRIGRR